MSPLLPRVSRDSRDWTERRLCTLSHAATRALVPHVATLSSLRVLVQGACISRDTCPGPDTREAASVCRDEGLDRNIIIGGEGWIH